jgi:hypothetical protein
MTKTQEWYIEDWTGRTCSGGKTFDTFEAGWDYIYDACCDPESGYDEQYCDDYYVVPVVPVR